MVVTLDKTASIRSLAFVSVISLLAIRAVGQDLSHFKVDAENQSGLTFSPDGKTAYWTAWDGIWGGDATSPRTIYFSQLENDRWSVAEAMPFSGKFNDGDPYVSPDHDWLYFVSDRPGFKGDEDRDRDIWRFHLDDERLERLSINSDAAEYSPVVTDSGALYFASARDADEFQGDLYRVAAEKGEFADPEKLGVAVNSATGEWNLWVSSGEDEILFEASSRPTNQSIPGDIYYSWRTRAGWTVAVPIDLINSTGSDLMPRFSPDGEKLLYTTAPIGGNAKIDETNWLPLKRALRDSYAPILAVANRSSHEVSLIDLAEGGISKVYATGEGPHLLSNVDSGRLLVTGFGEYPTPHDDPILNRPPFESTLNSRLTFIDIDVGSVVLDNRIEGCERPHASWIVEDRGFVSCQDEQSVVEINLVTGESMRRFDTKQMGSHVLAFEPRSRVLSVSNTESGSISLIHIDTGETRVVDLASGSEGAMAIDELFWVANALHGSISIVDPVTARVVMQTERLCDFPIAFSPDQHDHVWLACFGSAELLGIDRSSYKLAKRYSLDGQPLNLLVHPFRQIAYAAFPRENSVAEIDLEVGEIVRKITSGIEPDGLRWVH